jgi:catechol 2,3-dioxygenase-like lactoylglutathione lyase family enzyme
MLADSRLVYLFLYVRDLAVAKDFYANTLGLEVIEEDSACVKFDVGTSILALNRADDYGVELPDRRDNSTDIVLLVDDAEAMRSALESRGVRFLPTDRYDVGTIIDFYDPDGHWLTLYEPSDEALSWPSGERVSAVLAQRPAERRRVAGPTLAGADLIYIFFFVPDADDAQAFYNEFLGIRDLEGGPCSQACSGDEEGVIKYDTGGVILTTHFFIDSRNAERAPEGEEPDVHACPPRDLDPHRMQGAAPAFYVRDLEAVVAALRRKRPDFQPPISRSEIGLVATCVDPGGHRFFLYEPSDEAMQSPSGRKIAQIMDAALAPTLA